jgi:hypothetical protein
MTTNILMAHRHRHPDDHIFFSVLGKCFEVTELERQKECSSNSISEISELELKKNRSNDVKILSLRRKRNVIVDDACL